MVITLGRFIRLRRELLGLTQEDLAAFLECDQTYVSQLERDRIRRLPPPTFVRRLTAALQTTPDDLFRALGYLGEESTLAPVGNAALLARISEYTEELTLPEQHKELLRQDIRFLSQRARLQDTEEPGADM